MSLLELAQSTGLTLPFLTLLWTGVLGVVLHGAFPPPAEEFEEAALAACFGI
jgi:hypothetical protein